jgi:hypothetical protein
MENEQEDVKRMEGASLCAADQIRGMLSSEDVSALTQLQLQMYVIANFRFREVMELIGGELRLLSRNVIKGVMRVNGKL